MLRVTKHFVPNVKSVIKQIFTGFLFGKWLKITLLSAWKFEVTFFSKTNKQTKQTVANLIHVSSYSEQPIVIQTIV